MVYIVLERPVSYYDGTGDIVQALFSTLDKAKEYKNSRVHPKYFFIEV